MAHHRQAQRQCEGGVYEIPTQCAQRSRMAVGLGLVEELEPDRPGTRLGEAVLTLASQTGRRLRARQSLARVRAECLAGILRGQDVTGAHGCGRDLMRHRFI